MILGDLRGLCETAGKVTNYTRNGECIGCGECCSDFLPVSREDINRIRRYIKQHNVKERHNNVLFSSALDVTCPFRDNANRKCTIYSVRPAICREFKCDYTPERISENKDFFHHHYDVISMRQEFFGDRRGMDVLTLMVNSVKEATT